ncbi:type IV secretion system protein [Burkholderia sp. Ac-20365]|uniref:type IV secretion system protein n=1 Tax=Burkholderia sp. Ac-20365 TaxID=2703897 RepID=UPI00197C5BE9|nr:type IV secretion system protein [Burkholderia sp. Ac-20365]MBN3761060.1 type IV secretion system protein [Burkholderia sp. Ac-20365]
MADTASTSGCDITAFQTSATTLNKVVGFLLSPFTDADAVISSFAQSTATSLIPGAYVIGGILASGYLLWSTLKYLADGRENYLSVVIDIAAPSAVCGGVLHQYDSVTDSIGGIFTSLGVSSTGGLTNAIAQFGIALFNGLVTGLIAAFKAIACANILTSGMGTFFFGFMMVLLVLFAIVLSAIALAELIGVLLLGSILMGIGILVGPYFVISGVTPWSRSLANQWLGFTMSAFFYKSLISIVLTLLKPVIDTFNTQSAAALTNATGLSFGMALAMIGLIWIMRFIFLKIPGLAADLLGNGHAQEVSLVKDGMRLARMIAGMAK